MRAVVVVDRDRADARVHRLRVEQPGGAQLRRRARPARAGARRGRAPAARAGRGRAGTGARWRARCRRGSGHRVSGGQGRQRVRMSCGDGVAGLVGGQADVVAQHEPQLDAADARSSWPRRARARARGRSASANAVSTHSRVGPRPACAPSASAGESSSWRSVRSISAPQRLVLALRGRRRRRRGPSCPARPAPRRSARPVHSFTARIETVLGLHAPDQRLQPHAGTLGHVGERDLLERPLDVQLDRGLQDRLRAGLRGLGAASLPVGRVVGAAFMGRTLPSNHRPLSVRADHTCPLSGTARRRSRRRSRPAS